ncbi:hypothetical protein [Nocardia beijingensis]|uniref:hypothetical protein n=1 Tax=Nocardia beijingensis TaxID=95162 RepID=UPI003F4CF9CB
MRNFAATKLPNLGWSADRAASPVAVIEASNRAYFEAYKRNAKLMLILDQVAAIDPNFREMRRRRARAFSTRVARSLRDLHERG